ncbi:MAG: translation elongation factor 4 [Elusimicrobiota bacterium]
MNAEFLRNFSIIAHIDHGKSTLADRILEATGTIEPRRMQAQMMDSMELERERGITIKAKAVRLIHRVGQTDYALNLIDTPGHVDFSYEVSRALAACEGALLVVDATQGVEAQTLAHAGLAQELGLFIVPVINKVDLPSADFDGAAEQIRQTLRIDEPPIAASAKQGLGTDDILRAIIERIPQPQGNPAAPLSALIFDSSYNTYRGVVLLVRVKDGVLAPGIRIKFFSTGHEAVIEEVGYLTPKPVPSGRLSSGEVGYILCGIKDVHQVRVGDTVMEAARPLSAALPGYRDAKPVVFAGVFPINSSEYGDLSAALEKLNLEDSSFSYQPEKSQALGFGFRLGFLGLLHLDIVKERLEREFGLSLIATSPNAVYRIESKGKRIEVDNPAQFPEHGDIQVVEEPYVAVTIMVPAQYQEGILNLLKEKRGEYAAIEYLPGQRLLIKYLLPFSEMILNFYDRLKSISKGYASLDYAPHGYRPSDLVRIEILIHGDPVDALSQIAHRSKAYFLARALCAKLKELIDRQMFEVAIQARADGRIIARETIAAKRKDVLAKCYGGDITRKRKLLEKQKEGKRKAKLLGSVEVPPDAFLAVLRLDDDGR